MATVKKSNSKKKTTPKKQHQPDYYPVERRIPIGVFGSNLSGTVVGDCGKLASIVNRRLYRYGKLYRMKVDIDPWSVTSDFEVEVYALANTWDVQRAFALAKDTWEKASAEERESNSSNTARWRDFRVRHGVNNASVLDPVDYDVNTLALQVNNVGEHEDSSVDKNGAETYFTWRTGTATELGLMSEWIQAGAVQATPSTAETTSPYDGVNSDEMSDIEMEALGSQGNLPPYAQTAPSDVLVKIGTLYIRPGAGPTSSGGLAKLSTGYFDAPCGLFVLKFSTSRSNGDVSITLQSGDYKGVHALDMCQDSEY